MWTGPHRCGWERFQQLCVTEPPLTGRDHPVVCHFPLCPGPERRG
ncbi:hypothetical protein L083_5593 [Actinoplanes sp. N902-109]|nr:hypothetical protein L083_5593 [Actinoplanes sp. N902-109]